MDVVDTKQGDWNYRKQRRCKRPKLIIFLTTFCNCLQWLLLWCLGYHATSNNRQKILVWYFNGNNFNTTN